MKCDKCGIHAGPKISFFKVENGEGARVWVCEKCVSVPERRVWLRSQFEMAGRQTGTCPVVMCGCGKILEVRRSFRCLYCTEYFCKECAEIHFGKTVQQFYAERNQQS